MPFELRCLAALSRRPLLRAKYIWSNMKSIGARYLLESWRHARFKALPDGERSVVDELTQDGQRVPAAWGKQITSLLDEGEEIVAWFLPDLNHELSYAESLLVLTDRRLIEYQPNGLPDDPHSVPAPGAVTGVVQIHSKNSAPWPLDVIASLRSRDRSGLGSLDLEGPDGRLAFCAIPSDALHWHTVSASAWKR